MLRRRVHGPAQSSAAADSGSGGGGDGSGGGGGGGGAERGAALAMDTSCSLEALPLDRWPIPTLPASESAESVGVGGGREPCKWQQTFGRTAESAAAADSMPASPAIDSASGRK